MCGRRAGHGGMAASPRNNQSCFCGQGNRSRRSRTALACTALLEGWRRCALKTGKSRLSMRVDSLPASSQIREGDELHVVKDVAVRTHDGKFSCVRKCKMWMHVVVYYIQSLDMYPHMHMSMHLTMPKLMHAFVQLMHIHKCARALYGFRCRWSTRFL